MRPCSRCGECPVVVRLQGEALPFFARVRRWGRCRARRRGGQACKTGQHAEEAGARAEWDRLFGVECMPGRRRYRSEFRDHLEARFPREVRDALAGLGWDVLGVWQRAEEARREWRRGGRGAIYHEPGGDGGRREA